MSSYENYYRQHRLSNAKKRLVKLRCGESLTSFWRNSIYIEGFDINTNRVVLSMYKRIEDQIVYCRNLTFNEIRYVLIADCIPDLPSLPSDNTI